MDSSTCAMTTVMDEDILYSSEVEDIMCDQTIITAELNENKSCSVVLSATRLKVAVAVAAKAIFPLVINTYYAYLRNQQALLSGLRRQLLPTLAAVIFNSISRSLASVQKGITYPLAIRRPSARRISSAAEQGESLEPSGESLEPSGETPEPSVECRVLAAPSAGDALADVVFVHGLHGGLDRTWRQGRWRHDGHKLRDSAPVRRHTTGDLFVPPAGQSPKRAVSEVGGAAKLARKASDPTGCVGAGRRREAALGDEGAVELAGRQRDYSDCWPQDWLPEDCPGVRVIAINYTTDVLWCPIWAKKRIRTGMYERSEEMIEELLKLGVGKRPIVWVGHSKGGLFIKQILINAWENSMNRKEVTNLCKQSRGIMFYSVPHKGSSLADVTFPVLRRSVELLEIRRNCDFILDLHRKFVNLCEKIPVEVFSFIETSFTLMSFIYLKVVPYESADAGVGVKCDVPLDHREICKPAGRDCFLYVELVKLIKKCLDQYEVEL